MLNCKYQTENPKSDKESIKLKTFIMINLINQNSIVFNNTAND